MMHEVFGFAAVALVSFVLLRWVATPPASDGAAANVSVDSLRNMFPNIPEHVLRQELARAGSLPAAVERLLHLSQHYTAHAMPAAGQEGACAKSPTSKYIVEGLSEPDASPEVDLETWKQNPALRERLLRSRKQQMMAEART